MKLYFQRRRQLLVVMIVVVRLQALKILPGVLILPSTASETSSKITFAELADGSYKIRGKFVDAYGASSSDAASIYNSLTLDRNAPEISGTPTFSRSQVNATDRSVDLVIGLTEAASSRTTAQIILLISLIAAQLEQEL